jgi:phosphoribosylanthranilate isomerase
MTHVKICGIRNASDAEYVNEFKPEYAGFVFAGGSRRMIPPKKA